MNNRDPFFDNVKFILIILVILGHIPMSDSFGHATIMWIFSFHMPLFIFISGFFSKISDNNKFWNGIIKLVETLVVFTIIHLIIVIIKGISLDINSIFEPRWTLWYLMSLIWWRIMLFFTPQSIRNNHILLIVLSVVLALGAGWIPLNSQFSFQRTFSFLPFFVMGYVAGTRKINIKRRIPVVVALIVLSVAWCVFYHSVGGARTFTQAQNYMSYNISPIYIFMWRGAWLLLATLMSYCFLCIVPRKNYFWTSYGRITLFIYLYHSVILTWRYIIRDEFNLPTTLLWSIIYTAIVLCFILLINRVKLFHWLLNPVSSIIEK